MKGRYNLKNNIAYIEQNHYEVVNQLVIGDCLIMFPKDKNFVYMEGLKDIDDQWKQCFVDLRYLPKSLLLREARIPAPQNACMRAFCKYTVKDRILIIYTIFADGLSYSIPPKPLTHEAYSCVNSLLTAV